VGIRQWESDSGQQDSEKQTESSIQAADSGQQTGSRQWDTAIASAHLPLADVA
jgi:hypothetical protein